ITDDHIVKVMDLGVAQLSDAAMRLSQTGVFVGSVMYAAPEQFGDEDVDARADWYSLGLVLYELATGRHPLRAEDFAAIMRRRLEESPRSAGEINPQLSAYFEEVLHALLERARDRRLTFFPEEESDWWRARSLAIRAETRRPLRRIRVPRETALYGRDDDLARLQTHFAKAKAGDGQVVLLEGEAGIGKTRLADEFVGALAQAGEDHNFLFGSYPPGGAATAAGAFSEAYREHFGDAELEAALHDYLTSVPRLIPAFAALLRGGSVPSGAERLSKESLQATFVRTTRSLAAERPTIVLIDDLHFAPQEGRALFAALAQAVRDMPVLLLGTTRPGLPDTWLANLERQEHTARYRLARLGPKDLIHLLAESFHSEQLAHRLGAQVALKSDGNPFFAFEIVRGLREGQYITRRDDGSWITTETIREIEIPATVLELIQARLGALTEQEHEILDVASCCGYEFDPRLVTRALGADRIPTYRRCARIEHDHQLIRSVGRNFIFDHHQVQEAIYEALPAALREEYHAALGQALEALHPEPDGAVAVDLAEHYLKGARGPEGLAHLDRALTHLEEGYLHDQALTLIELALDLEGAVAGVARAKMLVRKVERLYILGRIVEQAAPLAEALALARAAGDDELETEILADQARCDYALGRVPEARAATTRNRDRARELGDRRAETNATFMLGNLAYMDRDYDQARECYEAAAEYYRETGDRVAETKASSNLSLVLQALGRFEEARARIEANRRAYQELGERLSDALSVSHLGDISMKLDHLAEAGAYYEQALALFRKIGNRRYEGNNTWMKSEVAARLGDWEECKRLIVTPIADFLQPDDPWTAHNAHMTAAEVSEVAGDPTTALEHYHEALRFAGGVDEEGMIAAQIAIGRLQSDPAEARKWLTQAHAAARKEGFRERELLAACRLALLPDGDPTLAMQTWAQHGDVVVAPARLEASYLLWRITGENEHLARAKQLLDHRIAHAPEAHRESMLERVALHRDIARA
ncbi:MAG: AAA family ATPase, partial [Planctomycetota bacterium]|nr:AAA family ATPase [Planctomycetota bacterium]